METASETRTRKAKYWRKARRCNVIGTVLGVLVLAPIMVMLFDRREPVVFEKGRMTPRIVHPGQVVEVRWYAQFRRRCDGAFTRRVIDASGVIHTFVIDLAIYSAPTRDDNDVESFTRTFQMPKGLVNGPAYYQPRGVHWCNILQKWLWPIPFDPPWVHFTVQAPDDPPEEVPPNLPLPGSTRGIDDFDFSFRRLQK